MDESLMSSETAAAVKAEKLKFWMVCSGLTLTTPVLLLIIKSNSAGYKGGQRISKWKHRLY